MLQALILENFGNHANTHITLDPGMTAFVGENGSGKSMISEAISWLFYGRTIRARQGWSPVVPGKTKVTGQMSSGLVFARKSLRSGTKLSCEGFKGGTRETNALVAEKFGTHSTFLQMRVFQRALLVRFSTAGDAERKAIIEDLLNIGYFDERYRALKADLKEINEELGTKERAVDLWRVRLLQAKKSLSDLRKPAKLDLGEDVAAAKATLKRLKKNPVVLPERPRHENISRDAVDEAQDKLARLAAVISSTASALQEKQQLVDDKLCPTCGAPTQRRLAGDIPKLEKKLEKLHKSHIRRRDILIAARKKYDKSVAKYEKARERYDTDVRAADKRNLAIRNAKDTIRRASVAEEHYRKAIEQYQSDRREIRDRIRQCRREWAKAYIEVLCYRDKAARLDGLIRVFGPKGARVYMLRDALRAISGSATALMSRLYNKDIRVVLAPSDTMKTIALSLELPDGTIMSHRGGSEGEKTLLDFTLLKVLAAIPRQVGTEKLPFIYDDITDAFDEGNKERVLHALAEEAKTTQVLLFTHEADLVKELLPSCRIYNVSDGQIYP